MRRQRFGESEGTWMKEPEPLDGKGRTDSSSNAKNLCSSHSPHCVPKKDNLNNRVTALRQWFLSHSHTDVYILFIEQETKTHCNSVPCWGQGVRTRGGRGGSCMASPSWRFTLHVTLLPTQTHLMAEKNRVSCSEFLENERNDHNIFTVSNSYGLKKQKSLKPNL